MMLDLSINLDPGKNISRLSTWMSSIVDRGAKFSWEIGNLPDSEWSTLVSGPC
jgi:hypothetical protein